MYAPHPFNVIGHTYEGINLDHLPEGLFTNSSMGGTYNDHGLYIPLPYSQREKGVQLGKTAVPEDVPEDSGRDSYKRFEETTTGVTGETGQKGHGTGENVAAKVETKEPEAEVAKNAPVKEEDNQQQVLDSDVATDDTEKDEIEVGKSVSLAEEALAHPVKISKIQLENRRLRETTEVTGEKKEEEPLQKTGAGKRRRLDRSLELAEKYNIR